MSNAMVDKIRKAMALAERQAGTPEGDTAARIARKLMHRHAVELHQLEEDESDPLIKSTFTIQKKTVWRRELMHGVAKHCELLCLTVTGTRRLTLYGRRSGVEIAEYLYAVILRQIERAFDAHVNHLKGLGIWATTSAGRKRSARNSFCRSAVWAVRERLKGMRDVEAVEDPQTTALMAKRSAEAERFAKQSGTSWRYSGASDWSWSQSGGDAGAAVNINSGVNGPGAARRGVARLE